MDLKLTGQKTTSNVLKLFNAGICNKDFMVFWTPIITCMPLCSQEIYLISTFLNFITYRNVQPYYRRGFEHFWKVKKASSTISYSQSQNILRLVYRLAYSAVTNNETDIDYYHEKLNARVTSQVSKWRKTYNLR